MGLVGDAAHLGEAPKDFYMVVIAYKNETYLSYLEESLLIKELEENEEMYTDVVFHKEFPMGEFGHNAGLIFHVNTEEVVTPKFERKLNVELKYKDDDNDEGADYIRSNMAT